MEIIGHGDVPKQIIQGKELYEDVLIIQHLSIQKWDREELLPQDTLFTLAEVTAPLEEVMRCYFEKRDRLQAAIELYMSTVYHPDQLSRARFLTLVQAIEAYHRGSMRGKYMDDKTYASGLRELLWNAIPATIGPDFRNALKNKLKYLHEFSLRKRLETLAEKYHGIIGKLLGPVEQFASSVTEFRNYLTHPDPSSRSTVKIDWKRNGTFRRKWLFSSRLVFLTNSGSPKSRSRRSYAHEASEHAAFILVGSDRCCTNRIGRLGLFLFCSQL